MEIFENNRKFGMVRGILTAFLLVTVSFFVMLLIFPQLNPSIQVDEKITNQQGSFEVINEEISQEVSEEKDNIETTQICIGEECNLPAQLFDITFNLEDKVVQTSKELIGIVTFESFGTEPTSVDLTFMVLDQYGNEIYREESSITVLTEEVVRWDYEILLELPDGEYTAILETLYNVDVFDEFKQEFEIKGRFILTIHIKKNWTWYVVVVIGIILLIFLVWIKVKKNRNKKVFRTKILEKLINWIN